MGELAQKEDYPGANVRVLRGQRQCESHVKCPSAGMQQMAGLDVTTGSGSMHVMAKTPPAEGEGCDMERPVLPSSGETGSSNTYCPQCPLHLQKKGWHGDVAQHHTKSKGPVTHYGLLPYPATTDQAMLSVPETSCEELVLALPCMHIAMPTGLCWVCPRIASRHTTSSS